jgi:hypothetical protein
MSDICEERAITLLGDDYIMLGKRSDMFTRHLASIMTSIRVYV